MSAHRKPTKPQHVDAIMDAATRALIETKWFAAERLASEALAIARRAGDFERMARISLPLQESRRQRLSVAFDAAEAAGGVARRLDAGRGDDPPEQGCWIVAPPHVGADARRIRLAAVEREVAVAILCCEPPTRSGLWPVVAVGQIVVRARIAPPLDATTPDLAWFGKALEQLGDVAIASAAEERPGVRRVDALLARLLAHPDHEKLHQALAAECLSVHRRRLAGEDVDDEPDEPRPLLDLPEEFEE